MHPAFSVIFLTTLIGVGQGLFLALYTGQVYSLAHLLPKQDSLTFYALGSAVALIFLIVGLISSVFHLGHPERAWRAVTQWRTSWLSREVIVLPVFMALVFAYGGIHYLGWTEPWVKIADSLVIDASLVVGFLASVIAFTLFLSTAMIYASLKFLQEWHSPLTVLNFTLMGLASGFMLASAFSAYLQVDLVGFFAAWAISFTVAAFFGRLASLIRNKGLRHKSSIQSAIGVKHPHTKQTSQGFMGGSFNTREFFHGKSVFFLKSMKFIFMLFAFIIPIILIILSYVMESSSLPILAFSIQYLGLVAERWYFFAEAKHPQNLYYQKIA